jgi:dipeptidyl aminopeptidase/acylaminoacyl peptidase
VTPSRIRNSVAAKGGRLSVGRGNRGRFFIALVALTAAALVFVSGSGGRGEALPDVEILSIDLAGRQTNLTANPALDTSPAIAPDGRIAFVSTREGRPDLYVMDADGRNVRRLTSSPFSVTGRAEDEDAVSCCDVGNTQVAWAPGGRRLVFDAANEYVPRSCFRNCVTWDTYVIGDDGSGLRLVAPGGRTPAWSPNGRSLAYLDGVDPFGVARSVAIRRLDGSRVRFVDARNPVADLGLGPTWSPRGNEIAFHAAVSHSGMWIHVVRGDGARRRRLARGNRPAWAPNGGRLAFLGRANGLEYALLTMSRTGGRKRVHTPPAVSVEGVAWSPDGRTLAFVSRHRRGGPLDLRTMTPDGRRTRVVAQLRTDRRLWAGPLWSPDGKRLVVAVELP